MEPAPVVAPDRADPAAPAPGDLMTRADELLTLAGTHEEAGRGEQAGRAYGQAQRIYMQLAAKFPAWRPEVIQQRLSHCDARIKAIIDVLLKETDMSPVEDAAPPPTVPEPAVVTIKKPGEAAKLARQAEMDVLATEISEAERDLTVAPPDPKELRLPTPASEPSVEGTDSPPGSKPHAPAGTAGEDAKPAAIGSAVGDHSGVWSRRFSSLLGGDKSAKTNAPAPAATATEPAGRAGVSAPAESGPAASPAGESPPVLTARVAVRELMASGQHEKARAVLQDNMAMEPANHAWHALLGIVECQAGQYARALEIFKELVREDETDAKAHVLLGAAYLGIGNLAVARDQVTLALEINPELPEAHYDLARLCMAIDPPDRALALQHYQRALRLGERRDPILERHLQAP